MQRNATKHVSVDASVSPRRAVDGRKSGGCKPLLQWLCGEDRGVARTRRKAVRAAQSMVSKAPLAIG
jgi:hypothetical protein